MIMALVYKAHSKRGCILPEKLYNKTMLKELYFKISVAYAIECKECNQHFDNSFNISEKLDTDLTELNARAKSVQTIKLSEISVQH